MLAYDFCKRHQVVLIANETTDETHTLYYVDTVPAVVLQSLQSEHIAFQLEKVDTAAFTRLLEGAFHGQDINTDETMTALSETVDLDEFRQQFAESKDLLSEDDDAPIIRFINALLTKAIRDKASDIHIESFERRLAIRMRIDGVMHEVMSPPIELTPFLISRVKIMAGLDIAEKRLPQDGRISAMVADRHVDIRVSTLPVANAERVVMRILDKASSQFALSSLGMPAQTRDQVETLLNLPHGLFIVCGPTGSGKTTTLYAALSALDLQRKNIMTVEDPIEYFLDGISQTQVNLKAGMDFAKGLRAILRQDPDIVMVGEIRDLETAKMAIQAGLTGHNVFSTLHTNTAVGSVMRLKDMGIEPFLIASSLTGVLAQRLVRRLCDECKLPANTIANIINHGESPIVSAYRAGGCEACNQTGYAGRIAVYELLIVDDEIKRLISTEADEQTLNGYIRQTCPSLYEQGTTLVNQGLTSQDELMRVIGAEADIT